MQDIILAIQLAEKVSFKVPDTMQKKVPRYREKVQIFKSIDSTGTKKYHGTFVLSTAYL